MSDSFNICIAAFMVILCVVVARHLSTSQTQRGDFGFSVFWAGWWLMILVIYALFHFTDWDRTAYWAIQSFDMFGAAALFSAAFALHKGSDFSFSCPEIRDIFCVSIILVVLAVLGGLFVTDRSPAWLVFVMAPSQVLGCVAFIALAVAAATRFPVYRVSIYIICGCYALLQVPGYYAVFVESATLPPNSPLSSAPFLKGCLAAGKGAFAIHALAILGTFNSDTASKPLGLIKVTLALLSIALSLVIIVLRVHTIQQLIH